MSCQAMNIGHDIEGNQQTCHAVETRETVETCLGLELDRVACLLIVGVS